MKKLSCLVVDDERLNRALMREVLSKQDCYIFEAQDGIEALKIISREKIDCIFTDISMPLLDGIELTKYLRNISGYPVSTLPIVAVSGFNQSDIEDDIKKIGFNYWIDKPYGIYEIENVITKIKNTMAIAI